MESVGWIPAPHDHQFGFGVGIVLIAVLDGTKGPAGAGGRGLVGGYGPGTDAAAEHAQETAQQTLDLIGLVQNTVGSTRIALI